METQSLSIVQMFLNNLYPWGYVGIALLVILAIISIDWGKKPEKSDIEKLLDADDADRIDRESYLEQKDIERVSQLATEASIIKLFKAILRYRDDDFFSDRPAPIHTVGSLELELIYRLEDMSDGPWKKAIEDYLEDPANFQLPEKLV